MTSFILTINQDKKWFIINCDNALWVILSHQDEMLGRGNVTAEGRGGKPWMEGGEWREGTGKYEEAINSKQFHISLLSWMTNFSVNQLVDNGNYYFYPTISPAPNKHEKWTHFLSTSVHTILYWPRLISRANRLNLLHLVEKTCRTLNPKQVPTMIWSHSR